MVPNQFLENIRVIAGVGGGVAKPSISEKFLTIKSKKSRNSLHLQKHSVHYRVHISSLPVPVLSQMNLGP